MHTLNTSKFKSMLSVAVLALAAFALATPGQAQSGLLQVHVPFEFDSGATHFASGVYKIRLDDSTPIIRIQGQKSFGFQTTIPDSTLRPSNVSKVVFHRFGSRYILKEIWVAGSTSYVHTPKSKLEQELATADQTQQSYVALLAMSR